MIVRFSKGMVVALMCLTFLTTSNMQPAQVTMKDRVAMYIQDKYETEYAADIVEEVFTQASVIGVPPSILFAIMHVESRFKHDAKNPKSSASGLMQVLAKTHKDRFYQPSDVWDIRENIRVGSEILGEYMGRSKSLTRALQRYSGNQKGYADKVFAEANNFKRYDDEDENKR